MRLLRCTALLGDGGGACAEQQPIRQSPCMHCKHTKGGGSDQLPAGTRPSPNATLLTLLLCCSAALLLHDATSTVLLPKETPPRAHRSRQCSRRRSVLVAPCCKRQLYRTLCRPLLSGLSGRHSVLPGLAVAQRSNSQRAKGGEGDVDVLQLTWPCQHDNVRPSAAHRELATLHSSCVERITPRPPNSPALRPPFPVASTALSVLLHPVPGSETR